MRRIGLILENVEAQHTRLIQRRLRIDQRRGQEILDPPAPDARMNMNNQHVLILLHDTCHGTPRRHRDIAGTS